ncbi:glycosyltransferase family 4 protein [Candidatus Borrarchaeum sp.]|uniref:glycosyltransferase family 4 protein n=1 Tax=Candidatus Borrarchaeum sp. TaxID=2846742 RepID=UPI00257FEC85|nr:glycosyltransferase family 4 protein [Candidatus Borrarchaeum sp.]
MKILQISNFFPPKTSGHGIYCYNLSRKLVEQGLHVKVITSQIPRNTFPIELKNGIEIERIPAYGTGWGISALSFIVPKLLKEAKSFDVVHLHSYLFLISNQAALSKKLAQFPLVLHLHGGVGIPDPKFVGTFKSAFKRFYDKSIGKATIKSADRVISISKTDKVKVANKFKIKRNKLVWIPNAIDISRFPYLEKKSTKNIGFIGRLELWKGVSYLPQIIREISMRLPNTKLIIIGDGSQKESLAAQSKGLPVEFLGMIPHKDITNIFRKIDVLILPSLLEGVPNVCLEAFSSGVPVVAFNVGGVKEIVKHDKTGFLIQPGDTKEFIRKTLILLNDTELRRKMAKAGRKLIEKYYTWDATIPKIISIFQTF